jgi:hypothetical protein
MSLAHVWEEDLLSRAVLGVRLFEVFVNGLYQIPRNISFDFSLSQPKISPLTQKHIQQDPESPWEASICVQVESFRSANGLQLRELNFPSSHYWRPNLP